jgi:hypothetical protein
MHRGTNLFMLIVDVHLFCFCTTVRHLFPDASANAECVGNALSPLPLI